MTQAVPIFLVLATTLTACGHTTIAGTRIEDTRDNREVYAVLTELGDAMEKRDASRVLQLVSSAYFEDMGTPEPEDDYGYHELRSLLPDHLKMTEELYVDITIYEIGVTGDKAYADLRFKSRARIAMSTGDVWDTQRDFNRIEFAREEGRWRIVSGL